MFKEPNDKESPVLTEMPP